MAHTCPTIVAFFAVATPQTSHLKRSHLPFLIPVVTFEILAMSLSCAPPKSLFSFPISVPQFSQLKRPVLSGCHSLPCDLRNVRSCGNILCSSHITNFATTFPIFRFRTNHSTYMTCTFHSSHTGS